MRILTDTCAKEIQQKILDKNGYCLTNLGEWIVDIIKNNKHYELRRTGSKFDISQMPIRTNKPFNLNNYKTVEEFLTQESNGCTIETFMSGCGLYAMNYESDFFLKCLNTWEDFILNEYPEFSFNKNNDEEMESDLYDSFNKNNCDDTFLYQYFCKMNLNEVFEYYNK